MKTLKHKRWLVAVATLVVATAAYAATQLQFTPPIPLSEGGLAYKSKIVRMGSGVLISAYGDTTTGAQIVYDVKAAKERPARDIYVRICNSLKADCGDPANWTTPINISQSADKTSMSTGWKGTTGSGSLLPYYGDVGKPNLKPAGPAAVLTWTSHYCPDGDLSTAGTQPPVQRAVKYLLREERVIPFSCTWTSYTVDNGKNWTPAQQLSTGIRDAAQDSSRGSYNSTTGKGNWAISWQEDPQGLQLGDAEGPGDGASGALVSHGTDVWYTDAAGFSPAAGMTWATPVRLTDNQTTTGTGGSVVNVYDGSGNPVADNSIESGQAGASRPNIGLVGTTAIVAYEETKGSQELDSGKYIRYHTFTFNDTSTNNTTGCIISDPAKNARRVRFVYQSTTNAMPLAIFWKEGAYDKGGPSDIVARRGMGGVTFDKLVPAVDSNCATGTSDYATALALNNQPADNLSSRTPTATQANLSDDTEADWQENALAHRGLLRGDDLWVGYSYTSDLGALQYAQTQNYNFWLRHYNVNGGWDNPQKVSNVTDTHINVREPRLVGTQGSSSACATDPTLCQNTNVFYIAWGLQTNVSPWDPAGPEDLGLKITRTTDAGATFEKVVALSVAQGGSGQDSAFESQINVRPDGNLAFAVWNQESATGVVSTEFSMGSPITVADTPTTTSSSSGGGGGVLSAWTLLALGGLGLAGLRKRQRS